MNKIQNQKSERPYFSTPHRTSYFVVRICCFVFAAAVLFFTATSNSSCNIYKFKDVSIPDSIKTIKVNFIENRAQYINPQLSPTLTDKLRQKIVSQTRLSQTNNDNADWIIGGRITSYTFSTSGISQQQVATNRLTIGVHIILTDQKANEVREYDISRNFEYESSMSLQEAEASLEDDIFRDLTDDIFNKLFSNW